MTVYYPEDELKAIPNEIWAKLPKYKSSRLVGLGKNPFPVEYDSSVSRAYKSKEAFEYVRGILHKIAPRALKPSDELIFRKNYSYGSDFSITMQTHAGGGWSHVCVYGKGTRGQRTASGWEIANQGKEFGKLWDATRSESIEKTISPAQKIKKEVQNTAALIKIGSHATKFSSELESLRSKIADGTLSQGDLTDIYYLFMNFNAECKPLKKKLPK